MNYTRRISRVGISFCTTEVVKNGIKRKSYLGSAVGTEPFLAMSFCGGGGAAWSDAGGAIGATAAPPSTLRQPPLPSSSSVPFFHLCSFFSSGVHSLQDASPYPGPTHGCADGGLSARAHAPEGRPLEERQMTFRCWRPSRPQRTLHCNFILLV